MMVPRMLSRSVIRSVPTRRFLSSTPRLLQEQPPKSSKLLENEKEYHFRQPPPPPSARSKAADELINKRIELIEKLKATILGLLALGLLVGGFELYQKRAQIKYYLFNEYDLSGFEESYNKMKAGEKKAKKNASAEFVPTNPNSSDVPGLYVVGNNENKQLVNEDIKMVTNFKRNSWFDDKILKQVKIGEKSSLAIDSKGDLIQWGNGYQKDSDPEFTLKGEKLVSLELSNGVIYCLKKNGELIYLPESKSVQKEDPQFKTSTWLSLSKKNFKKVGGVKFEQIESGLEHLLLLSNEQKVYVMATGLEELKESKGQFGLPQYSQFDKPPHPNELIELTNLNYTKDDKSSSIKRRKFTSIACGDYHNLLLDEFGSVWSWGINTFGSLGHTITYNTEIIPVPRKIELSRSYFKRNELPQCVEISAGGYSSFGTFKSSNIYNLFESYVKSHDGDMSNVQNLLNDETESILHLGWGKCLHGQLGIGHYVHSQSDPLKMKVITNLKDFNEKTQQLERIDVKDWSIGSKHSIVTLANNDVFVFGDNEFYQLGNGKRIKFASPSNIPKLIEPASTTAAKDDTNPKELQKLKNFKNLNNRLQLNNQEFKSSKGKKVSNVEQKIYAGHEASAIYYSSSSI